MVCTKAGNEKQLWLAQIGFLIVPKETNIIGSVSKHVRGNYIAPMAKLKLDLHDIYNKGWKIDQALNDIIEEAVEKRIPLIEIIPGKGSGQLKKKVIRFLEQKHIKAKYHRIDKDSKNFGRLFVRFKH